MENEQLKKLDETVKSLLSQIDEKVAAGESRQAETVKSLETKIDEALDAMRAEVSKSLSAFSLPGSAEETHNGEKFSFSRMFYGVATGDWSQSPLEHEVSVQAREKAQKAMATSPDTAGGFLIPTEVLLDQVIPLLYSSSVAMTLGARDLGGLRAIPTTIPRVSGGTTAYWVGEGSTITASDMTLANISLSPKILATLTAFSDLLGSVGVPSIDQMIREDMAMQAALKLDLAALKGTGSGGEPTGILNTTGIGTSAVTTSFGGDTYDELLAMRSTVRGNNALTGSLGWVFANADFLALEQTSDKTLSVQSVDTGVTNVQPLQRRTLLETRGNDDYVLGARAMVSTQLTSGGTPMEVIFGNWQDLVVASWGGMRVDTTNAVGFTTGQNHIRTMQYVDIGVRHAASFVTDDA